MVKPVEGIGPWPRRLTGDAGENFGLNPGWWHPVRRRRNPCNGPNRGAWMSVALYAALTAGMFLCLSASESLAFRCGDGVIGEGDTKSRVLIECGPPTYKDKVGARDIYHGGTGTRRKGSKSSRQVEQWTYNCGEGDFIYVLTFEGGRLVREETNGRGKGKSQCQGNKGEP